MALEVHTLNASSLSDLSRAFSRADSLVEKCDRMIEITIKARDTALVAMEEIMDAKSKHGLTSGGVGTAVGGTTFVSVSSATAPFLGPFCVVAGGVAAILGAVGVNSSSRAVFYSQLKDKYGEALLNDALGYKRSSNGVYIRKEDRTSYPDWSPSS